jgi:predicted nuclease of predicted toxin-antitoxin system
VTNDKDFGEKIFREQIPHKGVVLIRLADERAMNKIEVLQRLLTNFADSLKNQFIVVTEKSLRVARQ